MPWRALSGFLRGIPGGAAKSLRVSIRCNALIFSGAKSARCSALRMMRRVPGSSGFLLKSPLEASRQNADLLAAQESVGKAEAQRSAWAPFLLSRKYKTPSARR